MSHERWRIQVVEAHLQHDTDSFFKMDPYVSLKYHDKHWKSAVVKHGGKKPIWKHQRMKCAFEDGIPEEDMVHVQLWDHDFLTKDKLIAEMEIRIGDIVKDYPVD